MNSVTFLDRFNYIKKHFNVEFYTNYIRFLKSENIYYNLVKRKNIIFSQFPSTKFEVLIGSYDILCNDMIGYKTFLNKINKDNVYKYFQNEPELISLFNQIVKTYQK